ncbi:uncharacterized protein PV07_10145 [Cladophialophora immunda]|uniref:BTB domain-containing protein n=1 Tax=Cladophialophora immunda TaxID=569365 RepID=A0A0D1Z9Q5_9EURO|nr:uncharacterized protein PV07_10145 [Cladophialophora immunda]KIW24431.1 hypothetical protein PV07_10145 [Cladophialophora immunda]OQV02629.1 BTB/POZ domain-containing protein [Cladophialophora immunda]
MDQEHFSNWSPPRDDLDGLISGYDASTITPEVNRAAWSEQGTATSSPRPSRYLEPSSPGIIRSPLQQPTSTVPSSRPLPQRRIASSNQIPGLGYGEQSPPVSFEPPLRSIFVSGPPTASVSANTALASLSAAVSSNNSGSLAALTNAGGSRRTNIKAGDTTPFASPAASSSRHPLLNPEKDVDDPTTSAVTNNFDPDSVNTSTTLARLFITSDGTSPDPTSRVHSHLRTVSSTSRSLGGTASLQGHLFHHGFEEGRHSDITVYAFGQSYRLHKLLLDRVPYFSSAFSGSWAESTAREMKIPCEDLDPNITKNAFELALKRIYGTQFPRQEEEEAIGLFATSCWLDMPDLVDSCVDSILRQMQPATLHSLIKLVTNNYYGKAGDRILASAKAMLCKEGWEMPYEYWDEIPAEIIREIVGGDPFFVPSEWERWYLALKLLNRRLRAKAIEGGLVSSSGRYLYPKPTSLRFFAVRFDAPYRITGHNRYVSEKDEAWVALYTSPEIAPLLVLLDEGIHYVHLRFEQLQQIRTQKDILGVPVLPEKVIGDALWMSMELRQKVLNARETDETLGLSEVAEEFEEAEDHAEQASVHKKGKLRDDGPASQNEVPAEMESGSWDGNGKPRKFWIPSNDVSCVMGGTQEACVAANSTSIAEWSTHAARLSASLEPTDVAWALDFTSGNVIDSGRPPSRGYSPTSAPRFSYYPPFRFSAEFPSPRTLKEKKRVYSHTVWYAGSLWNLYIQRVNNSKVPQLGIYLHRAKDKDPCEDPLALWMSSTVDDRIGQLEREMLLRKNERRNRSWHVNEPVRGSAVEQEEASAESTQEYDTSNPQISEGERVTLRRRMAKSVQKTSQNPEAAGRPSSDSSPSDGLMLDSDEEDAELLRANRKYNVSAMPPYMDGRPTIRTYFKIYSPSKGGRLLSIYESAPDKFDVSKSWGWKSSQMQLDDGIGGCDTTKSSKDGKLRYMVVIGNI